MAAHMSDSPMKSLEGDDTNSSSGEEDEWFEDELQDNASPCLYCNEMFSSADAIYIHSHEFHNFSMEKYFNKFQLDTFSYIKFINYIRSMKLSADVIENLSKDQFDNDKFLKPAIDNDLLLMFDVESFEANQLTEEGNCKLEEISKLRLAYKKSQETVDTLTDQLHNTRSQLENIRAKVKEMMASDGNKEENSSLGVQDHLDCQDSENEDDEYFGSYSHFSIHHEMLTDVVRTKSYQEAIMNNSALIQNKTVLDVGCGSGILSMFCASAGASTVYGIDQSEIIHLATDIVMENNLQDKITLIRGRLENIKLPQPQVDIIVSEWMGYFLLFECMLETVIYARDKYLKPGGLIFPDKFSISVAGISDLDYYDKHVGVWHNVYGYKMSSMKRELLREGCIEIVQGKNIVTNCVVVKTIDMYSCQVSDIEFIFNFELEVTQDRPITSIIGYFDTMFDECLDSKLHFSTSPNDPATHWKQTVFILPEPVEKSKGERIIGKIDCRRQAKDPRSLFITLILDGRKLVYSLQ